MPLALCLAVACGYHMAGSGKLPGGIQKIAVNVLENRSGETGVETTMTNAVVIELNRRRKGVVVDEAQAEGILGGTIESLRSDTVSHKGSHTSLERRVYVTVSLKLTDPKGKVLWKANRLQAEQAYPVVEGDKPATENNRRQAIATLAQRLAENIYRRLTDEF